MISWASICGRLLTWGGHGLNLMLPTACPMCRRGTTTPGICDGCVEGLVTPVERLCPRCGSPRDPTVSSSAIPCPRCRQLDRRIDRVVALGPYQTRLRDGVLRCKHAPEESLVYAFGRLLGQRWQASLPDSMPSAVIPVPMHWYREFRRGMNTALVLATGAARELGVPVAHRLVQCHRLTRKQSMLTIEERHSNLRGAFRLGSPEDLRGHHFVIVDDTMTTGATMEEIARVLRRHGTRQVSALVIARAISEYQ